MAQTSAGVNDTFLSVVNGWIPIDIIFPTDCNRAIYVDKNTADSIAIMGKAQALNSLTGICTTIEVSLAVTSAGDTVKVIPITYPATAIRAVKTGTAGIANVILIG